MTPTSTVLQMWNITRVIPVGEAKVERQSQANNKLYKVKFIVVDDDSGLAPLHGSKANQHMNITLYITGTLPGVAHFKTDSSITPVGTATLRIHVALREADIELNKLQAMNVITQVEEPTDWVSNVVVARKKHGDLIICVDPHALNKALKRETYQLPTLDNILPELLNHRSKIRILACESR